MGARAEPFAYLRDEGRSASATRSTGSGVDCWKVIRDLRVWDERYCTSR